LLRVTQPRQEDGIRSRGKFAPWIESHSVDIAFDAPQHGIDLVFSDGSSHETARDIPRGTLILTAVFFFSEGREGHRVYRPALPAQLKFEMSGDEGLNQLGIPEFRNPILPVYRWRWRGTKLAETFVDSLSSIARVS